MITCIILMLCYQCFGNPLSIACIDQIADHDHDPQILQSVPTTMLQPSPIPAISYKWYLKTIWNITYIKNTLLSASVRKIITRRWRLESQTKDRELDEQTV